MKYAFLLIGVLLGYICTPTFTVYEITDIVWVQSDPTRYEMLDHIVCYMDNRRASL